MDRRTFVTGSAGIVGGFALGGVAAGQDDEEVIRVGSDIPYNPFEYRTEEGELVGFDVDMAEAIFVDQLDREYEFVQTGFDTIIPSLNNGNFRVIMSAMTINEERAEQVDFSDPYFVAFQTVAVLEGSDIESLEDLRGQTVAVQKGTTGEAAAQELQEEFDGDLTIDSYDQIPGAFSALRNAQAVGVINDNAVNLQYVEDRENVVMLEGEGEAAEEFEEAPPYLTLTVERYGIAFRQDDDEFREQVNEALGEVIESGAYEEIYAEYFPGEPPTAILEAGRETTTADGETETDEDETTAEDGTTANGG
ncbi:basic amino acid ABC transporter substrate-binding protein [Halorussus salilacus]|uniref:basic amino acid ABC transporter substrate-binding protein n=1 Tax=Halorussus salilacus TaxID=2953750 RepID=UPI0034A3321D